MEIQGDVGELWFILIGYHKGETMELVGFVPHAGNLAFSRDFWALSGGVERFAWLFLPKI